MAEIEAIETIYLEADVSSVTFSSIPATYEHLQLRTSIRSAYAAADYAMLYIRLNGDTGANYTRHYMYGHDSSTGGGGDTSQTFMLLGITEPNATEPSAVYANHVIDLLDYANTNKYTTASAINGQLGWPVAQQLSGLWDDTSAVSTILLYDGNAQDFVRGSEFTLYGIQDS